MKQSILLTVMCVIFSIANAQDRNVGATDSKKPASEVETIVFAESEHDFGAISRSKGVVECEFSFKNAGKTPLIVIKVTPSCGCTVADWSKEPIAPGKKGFVKASFNPNGANGEFSKNITVLSDGNPSRINLKIKGVVK